MSLFGGNQSSDNLISSGQDSDASSALVQRGRGAVTHDAAAPAPEESPLRLSNDDSLVVATPVKAEISVQSSAAPGTAIVVTTELDVVDANDGLMSLREAIDLANSNSDADEITFAASLAGKDIILTAGLYGGVGQLTIKNDVKIQGGFVDGSGAAGQDGVSDIHIRSLQQNNDASRIFQINGAATDVELSNLYLSEGVGKKGGTIFANNIGTLTLSNTQITSGFAKAQGAGIYAVGSDVVMVNSAVSYCQARGNGAGLWISSDSTLTSISSSLTWNSANRYGGGVLVYGSATFINTTISSNACGEYGGGIDTGIGAHLTLINSTVTNNSAFKGGGIDLYSGAVLTMLNSVVAGNQTWVTDPVVLATVLGSIDVNELGTNSTINADHSFFGEAVTVDSGASNTLGGNALLGNLLLNGGLRPTHSPLDGSPLIGGGTTVGLPTDTYDLDHDGDTSELLPLDARGGVRTVGAIDIGAVEQIVDEVIHAPQAGNAVISGGLGNDIITGTSTYDILDGGDGNDIIDGITGADTITGGNGDDLIRIDDDSATVDGGAGVDTLVLAGYSPQTTITLALLTTGDTSIQGSTGVVRGIENLIGGKSSDVFTGSSAANILDGGFGGDTLSGEGGDDVIIGGWGGSTTGSVSAGLDVLNGGDGIDTLSYAGTDQLITVNLATGLARQVSPETNGRVEFDTISNFENITGGNLGDVLTGNAGANILDGGRGDDILRGALGKDTLIGGEGFDWVDFRDQTQSIQVVLNGSGSSKATLAGGAIVNTLNGVEAVMGGFGSDVLVGDAGDNRFIGGPGQDTTDGRGGFDIVDYSFAVTQVSVVLTGSVGATVFLNGTVEERIFNIEGVIGGRADDFLTGDSLDNYFKGSFGRDLIRGSFGFDVVDLSDANGNIVVTLLDGSMDSQVRIGGALDDILNSIEGVIGGKGNDRLTGNSVDNRLVGGMGSDTLTGNAGNDTLLPGAGNNLCDGGIGIDTVSYEDFTVGVTAVLNELFTPVPLSGFGIYRTENLIGGAGNDTLTGNAADNRMEGGLGSDALNGMGGIDTLSYESSVAGVSVNLATGAAGGGAAGDTFLNFENLVGSKGADELTGNSGANRIEGLSGNDVIRGGGGLDVMAGGAGDNTFAFQEITDSGNTLATADIITDFDVINDKIDLSAIDAKTSTSSVDDAFALVDGPASPGEVTWEHSGTDILVVLDNGSGTMFILLKNIPVQESLSAANFIL